MKIKLSKSQWQSIGKQAGWIKQAQSFGRFDQLELGPTPADEDCAQVGTSDYYELTKIEVKAYIHQLQRMFPNMPQGVYLRVQSNPHDFGTYHEVAVKYPEDNEEAGTFAFNMENNLPQNWDEEAKRELTQSGYFEKLKNQTRSQI